MKSICFILFLATSLTSCIELNSSDQTEEASQSKKTRKEGLVKTYDEHGHLKTVINYKGGLKHGKSFLYYEGSDQVMLEMNYEKGKRSGVATKYYESGKKYSETPYKNGEVNGVVKLFFRNGNLKAEIPYNFSKPGLGLKEYYTNGELKTEMPKMTSRKEMVNGSYLYYFSIDDCYNANFFVGALLNNRYLIAEPPFVDILPRENNQGIFKYYESQFGETVNIICKCETKARNPYITRLVIELGR